MTHSLVLELGGGLLALVDGGTSLRLSLAALDEVLGVEEPAKLLIELSERRRFGLVDLPSSVSEYTAREAAPQAGRTDRPAGAPGSRRPNWRHAPRSSPPGPQPDGRYGSVRGAAMTMSPGPWTTSAPASRYFTTSSDPSTPSPAARLSDVFPASKAIHISGKRISSAVDKRRLGQNVSVSRSMSGS